MLHAIDAGAGDRIVVLLHGMMGSAESWHRVTAELVTHGYRVLALDLPGHGLSAPDPHLTVQRAAAEVIETVRMLAPTASLTVIGHSWGGTVLAAAASRLRPHLAVHVDVAPFLLGGGDVEALTGEFARARRGRMDAAALREKRPYYSAEDAEVEARAAERFDPATMAAIFAADPEEWWPQPGAIVVRAQPSTWVSDEQAARLRDHGVDVRDVPGAAHTVWYSHFDAFCAALPEVFGREGW